MRSGIDRCGGGGSLVRRWIGDEGFLVSAILFLIRWDGIGGEKVESSNTDLMQTRIPGFNDALWRLETLGDRDVVQY